MTGAQTWRLKKKSRGMGGMYEDDMPVLSKFYGIVIRMLCLRAFDARFYAIYENCELVVNIWPLKIIEGDAPAWVRAKVLEWASDHQEDLLSAWNRCKLGMRPQLIAPLP